MLNRTIDTSPHVTSTPAKPLQAVSVGLEDQVQNALNLFLPLKNPSQMPALLASISAVQPLVDEALSSLHYVHFARFLPSPDGSLLWVITSYDGGLPSYIMDFVAVLGDVFTEILQFVRGAPPLPVKDYPREFVEFVVKSNVPVGEWSAYPQLTVIDVISDGRRF
jgi:hypothetical protein